MKNRTFRVIIVLVGTLFLNIEAAHAGLVSRLKLYIEAEFSPAQLVTGLVCLSAIMFLSYVVFTPIQINNQRWAWYTYFTIGPEKLSYRKRRVAVKRIQNILQVSKKTES